MPLSILASGMVTGVGLTAASSCAAIRCGVNNFVETRFMDKGGEWIIGSPVPLEQPWRGEAKLLHMVVPAIRECLATIPEHKPASIALLLCLAEPERPGRLAGLDETFLMEIQVELGLRFHEKSRIVPRGKISGAVALEDTGKLIQENGVSVCIVAGVDSYLVASTLAGYEEKDRLLTSKNSNGFIPGEAAAAVLVGPGSLTMSNTLLVNGLGFAQELATVESEEPLKADGLVKATQAALAMARMNIADTDYRITDTNGEQYAFKEATLALSRMLRKRKEWYEIWHPADCIGEVGAAIGPAVLAVALAGSQKNYAPGRTVWCHFGNSNGERASMVLAYRLETSKAA